MYNTPTCLAKISIIHEANCGRAKSSKVFLRPNRSNSGGAIQHPAIPPILKIEDNHEPSICENRNSDCSRKYGSAGDVHEAKEPSPTVVRQTAKRKFN